QKQQKTIEHLQSFVDRFKATASKARQAQSRVKALERIELIAPVYASSPFTFAFREPDAAPNPMLVVDDVDCGYQGQGSVGDSTGTTTILSHVKLSIQNGQRIGLLGANGQGKSTLIKTLFGELATLAGDVTRGKGLEIGYFAQHQLETLRSDDSPLQHLSRIAGGAREQELRNFLGSFNFNGEMATSSIARFSGGEKARLALALIIWRKPNLLLLDEPTNHLDLETRHALTTALAQFDGTLILVSHDRHLLRATTDAFLLVGHGEVKPFDGDLDDYKDWLLDSARIRAMNESRAASAAATAAYEASQAAAAEQTRAQAAAKVATQTTAPATTHATADKSRATPEESDPAKRREQRRLDAAARQQSSSQRKPLQMRIQTLEKELEALNAQKATLDALVADPASYDAARKSALTDALRKQGELTGKIADVENAWLQALEALEQMDA
ncbi:MAG: ATP-binding cassette domain-containing protein, partial [Janthinobacterium lividum]